MISNSIISFSALTYLVVLCSEGRLGVEKLGEPTAKSTGQNQQLLPTAGRQCFVKVIIDPDASVITQTVDILLTECAWETRRLPCKSTNSIDLYSRRHYLAAPYGSEGWSCATLASDLSCG